MAGLLIKELLIRGDLERCLIVAPGSLVEQWQDELSEKVGLGFEILTRDQIDASITGNPFVEKNRLIVRLDMAARSDELKAKLQAAPDWDLIICDEPRDGHGRQEQPRARPPPRVRQTRTGRCFLQSDEFASWNECGRSLDSVAAS